MHVAFNYHNVSFERGGHPPKMTVCGGGMRKKRTEWGGMVIRNGGTKNSTSPPYLIKNERSLRLIFIGDVDRSQSRNQKHGAQPFSENRVLILLIPLTTSSFTIK